MTAEPMRDPEGEQPEAPQAASVPPEPAPAPSESAGDAYIAAEAAAVPPVDGGAAGMVVPAATADAPVVPSEVTPDVAAAPATAVRPSRRPVVLAVLRRLFVFALGVVLLVAGVTLGATTFQRTRAVPIGADGAIALSDAPPVVAQEFITALGANNSDAMRSSLTQQPNKDLTDEFTRFGIKKIMSVETLGTSVDGSRSATEVLLHAEKTDGLPFEVNLVILVDGGTIEGFR